MVPKVKHGVNFRTDEIHEFVDIFDALNELFSVIETVSFLPEFLGFRIGGDGSKVDDSIQRNSIFG